jgi:hypothetical protein
MPFTGYVCPAGTPETATAKVGQRNRIEHCVGVCENPCVSPPLLAAMWLAENRNHHTGTYLSASMIANDVSCARQTWYERRPDLEVYESPRKRFWPFRGTVIHGLIEGSGPLVAPFGWMQELRMAVPLTYRDYPAPVFEDVTEALDDEAWLREQAVAQLAGRPAARERTVARWTGEYDSTRPLVITVGGTTDCYNPYRRLLHDYKTLSDTKIPEFLREELGGRYSPFVKDAWVMQTNIYAWLVSRTPITDAMRDGFARLGLPPLEGDLLPAPTKIEMQLVSMMEFPLTGRPYVPQREYVPVEVGGVPVLPADEVEAFVRERALTWYRYLTLGEQPPVVPVKQQWMCKHCPFNGDLLEGAPCRPKAERAAARANPKGGA